MILLLSIGCIAWCIGSFWDLVGVVGLGIRCLYIFPGAILVRETVI